MESMLTLMTWNLAAVAALMTVGWSISLPLRNVTVVDSLWGLGFVLIAWISFAWADGYPLRRGMMAVLTSIRGLRLCAYLSWRNWGKGEDPRYGTWRQASGEGFWLVRLFKGSGATPGTRIISVNA